MALETNLAFTLGADWEIDFSLNDAEGADLDLTGAVVKFRLSRRKVLALQVSTQGGDIAIDSPSDGNGTITVSPDAQADLVPAVYDYEVRAYLADSRVTTQAFGALTVAATLF